VDTTFEVFDPRALTLVHSANWKIPPLIVCENSYKSSKHITTLKLIELFEDLVPNRNK
jgi:hypothetical protein